ncbi:MAG: DUF1203 domain-containing protein [Pseudomonadota bacterium]
MSFQIEALPAESFAALFALSDDALQERHIARRTVDCAPGYPCRVSLVDASVGETVLLLNHTHLDVASPYRASHAIFVREQAETATPLPGEIPPALRLRLLSLRAFDENGYLLAADVVHGREVDTPLAAMIDDPRVAFVDIHNAKPGCFAARARRVA